MEKAVNSDKPQMRIPSAQSLIFALLPPVSILLFCIWRYKESRKWKLSLKSLGWLVVVVGGGGQGTVTMLEANWPGSWSRQERDREINGETGRSWSARLPRSVGGLATLPRTGPASTAQWDNHGPDGPDHNVGATRLHVPILLLLKHG